MYSGVTCIEQIWTTVNTVKLTGGTPVSGIQLTFEGLCSFNRKNASKINILPLTIALDMIRITVRIKLGKIRWAEHVVCMVGRD
jgi:hypothetical protein